MKSTRPATPHDARPVELPTAATLPSSFPTESMPVGATLAVSVGARLVAFVRAKGSDASDVRDAAHEACHALQWRVKRKWTRENIHAKAPKGRMRSFGVADEITARAVEAIVCGRLGVPYDLPKWAMVCWMEQLKNEKISLPAGSWLEDRIRERMRSSRAAELADKVLALTDDCDEQEENGK